MQRAYHCHICGLSNEIKSVRRSVDGNLCYASRDNVPSGLERRKQERSRAVIAKNTPIEINRMNHGAANEA